MEFAKLYFNIVPLLATLAVVVIGIVVLINDRNDKVTRFWFLTCLSAALWSAFFFLTNNASSREIGLIMRIVMDSFGILVVYFWLKFIITFLNQEAALKWLIRLVATTTVLMLIFNTTHWFVKDVVPKYVFNYYVEANFGYYIFAFYFTTIAIIGLLLLTKASKTADNNRSKQIRNIFWGSDPSPKS